MSASKKNIITLLGLFLMASGANAFAFTGQKLAGEAKINLNRHG